MGFSFRLAEIILLYATFHRQDSTYHGLCYTSRGSAAAAAAAVVVVVNILFFFKPLPKMLLKITHVFILSFLF